MTYNIDMECALLGGIILEPDVLPDVMSIVSNINPFADAENSLIFDQIRAMYNAGEPVELLSLGQRAALKGKLPYLAELTSKVSCGASATNHARILCEMYMRRRLQAMSTNLIAKAESSDDIGGVIEWAQRSIDETLGVATGSRTPRHVGDILTETLLDIELRVAAHNSGRPMGILSGLKSLDDSTGGFKGGQLIILAGRPAVGKSAVMLHFAHQMAMSGSPVVIFSLEMQGRELGDRLILGSTQIDNKGYKIGDISTPHWQSIEVSNAQLRELPIHIADNSNTTIQAIKAQCQRLKAKGQCSAVIIDYLQLLSSHSSSQNREREVAETTRQAKVMASELDIPVIMLSQLSRKVEERADKTPLLSDLRESGAIEQDADIVLFISRPAMYGNPTIETPRHGTIPSNGIGVISIAKQRNGRTGNCYFRHTPDMNRISDL